MIKICENVIGVMYSSFNRDGDDTNLTGVIKTIKTGKNELGVILTCTNVMGVMSNDSKWQT